MGSGAEQYAERNHNGVPETIEYLASLDDHELVWTFSPWVLRADHAAAMRIFVQRTNGVLLVCWLLACPEAAGLPPHVARACWRGA